MDAHQRPIGFLMTTSRAPRCGPVVKPMARLAPRAWRAGDQGHECPALKELPIVFDRFHRARDAGSKPGSGR
jgi:hypothetical protein